MKTIIITTILSVLLFTQITFAQTIKNFSSNGKQLTRFDNLGNAIDAHDGEIALFNGVYYLYGTSYDCGFEWGNKSAPFCGFKVYSSTDLNNWTDKGFLFNAKTTVWQTRCDGKTYGCFRPHVIYNQKTRLYVLWINVYDNRVGYRVFTSKKPTGPFTEVKEPTLAVNSEMSVAGLNNGDHDTFVDDDGTAYLAYTDWRTKGSIVIEKLSANYLTGTGQHVKSVTDGKTEAPALFKRKGIYYVVYSDPNCGYCSGTGASYRTAKSPLGPWSEGKKISDNSCGGQPSFVSTFKLNSETVFLFGSDLWNNAAKNEAQANFYWAPLTFAPDGSINPLVCGETNVFSNYSAGKSTQVNDNFTTACDINKTRQWAQSFTADRNGTLYQLDFTTFKSGYPNADLMIEFYNTDNESNPTGSAIAAISLKQDTLSWAPKNYTIKFKAAVIKGNHYLAVIKSTTTTGCYGFEYKESQAGDSAATSNDGSGQFTQEKGKAIKLKVHIK